MNNITIDPSACQITDDPIPANTIEFLHTLYGNIPDGWIEITYIAPADSALRPRVFTEWAQLPLYIEDTGLGHLHDLNAAGYGVYFGCAVRRDRKDRGRGTQSDATWLPMLWCDVDGVSADEGYDRLIALDIWPSIIISSGGGVHGYWLLDTPLSVNDRTLTRIRRTLHGIAIAIGSGGDTKVRDLARVMRLPGFMNTKRDRMCEVIDFIPGGYEFTDIERRYAWLAPTEEIPVTRIAPEIAQRIDMPKWVQAYLDTGAGQGERNTRAYAAARALLDCGYSITEATSLITARAAADGLPRREITTILRSAEKAPRTVPNMPSYMKARMAAADAMLRGK